MRRLAEQPRKVGVELAVVDRVAELVEHRVGPALVRLDVAEHAHVALAVDVDAERVLVLAVACVEVAALASTGSMSRPRPCERAAGQRLEVGAREVRVEIDRAAMPADPGRTGRRGATARGRCGRHRTAVASRSSSVGLPRGERRGGEAIDFVERGEQASFVELAGGEREGEVVAEPERVGGVVAQAGRAGGRRRRPRRRSACPPPTRRVARRSRRSTRRISRSALSSTRVAVEVGAVAGEAGVDRGLEVDECARAGRSGPGAGAWRRASTTSAAVRGGSPPRGARAPRRTRRGSARTSRRARSAAARRASASGDACVLDSHQRRTRARGRAAPDGR